MTPDPLGSRCRYCRAPEGRRCTDAALRPCRPHKVRQRDALAVAAHSDPALDEHFADSGPCLICGVEGLGARHRRVDAVAGMLAAGETPETCAYEHGCSVEAVGVVAEWMTRWAGAWS